MVRHTLQGTEEVCQRTSQQVLAPVGRVDVADQCVDGEFVEFEKSHGSFQG